MKFWEELRNLLKAANLPAVPSEHRSERWGEIVQQLHDTHLAKAGRERRKAAVAEGAEEIYALYPKKVGRDEALKAITGALKKHPKEYLLDKTNQFRVAVEGWPTTYRHFQDGGDRCPHPATWFNQGRFQDDPKEWRRAGARSAPAHRPASAALTKEQEDQASQDAEAMRQKFLAMPEPPKGSLEHSLWIEARTTAAVSVVTEASTAPIRNLEHEQRLRQA
jgi:hypothetical protein